MVVIWIQSHHNLLLNEVRIFCTSPFYMLLLGKGLIGNPCTTVPDIYTPLTPKKLHLCRLTLIALEKTYAYCTLPYCMQQHYRACHSKWSWLQVCIYMQPCCQHCQNKESMPSPVSRVPAATSVSWSIPVITPTPRCLQVMRTGRKHFIKHQIKANGGAN